MMHELTKNSLVQIWTLLGKELLSWANDEELLMKVQHENPWFIQSETRYALKALGGMLETKSINRWLENYNVPVKNPKNVGVVMAGNIPMVGFHDWLCVLSSGHFLNVKYSSQDSVLMRKLKTFLEDIEPTLGSRIFEADKIKGVDAVIATGSDNTARYFDYYFRSIPHIIRKNRNSVAVLTGEENSEQLTALGEDVFKYFGLGCRNVSKLMIPAGYDLTSVFSHWQRFVSVMDFHKYFNNYEYQKAILLMNQTPHLDSGYLLCKEDTQIASPMAMLYYEYYTSLENCIKQLDTQNERIQCVVSISFDLNQAVLPGNAQAPGLNDYADGIDVMHFLSELGESK